MRLLAIFALVLLACTGTTTGIGTTTPQSVDVQSNSDFTLRAGQTARVENGALTISFLRVPEDSRCPVDVQCVWAGNAVVSLTIADAADGKRDASLNTTLEPKSVAVAGWEIKLLGVDPVKKQGVAIPQPDYVATLRVSRL